LVFQNIVGYRFIFSLYAKIFCTAIYHMHIGTKAPGDYPVSPEKWLFTGPSGDDGLYISHNDPASDITFKRCLSAALFQV